MRAFFACLATCFLFGLTSIAPCRCSVSFGCSLHGGYCGFASPAPALYPFLTSIRPPSPPTRHVLLDFLANFRGAVGLWAVRFVPPSFWLAHMRAPPPPWLRLLSGWVVSAPFPAQHIVTASLFWPFVRPLLWGCLAPPYLCTPLCRPPQLSPAACSLLGRFLLSFSRRLLPEIMASWAVAPSRCLAAFLPGSWGLPAPFLGRFPISFFSYSHLLLLLACPPVASPLPFHGFLFVALRPCLARLLVGVVGPAGPSL